MPVVCPPCVCWPPEETCDGYNSCPPAGICDVCPGYWPVGVWYGYWTPKKQYSMKEQMEKYAPNSTLIF